MSTRGAAATRPAPRPAGRPRERTRPRPVPRARRRRTFRLGLTIIPLVAVLFSGVVWLNAATLSLTKKQGQVARQIGGVQDQLGQLKAAQAQFDNRIRAAAEKQGMVRPKSGDWTYVPARPGR